MIADPAGVLARYFGVLDEEAGQAYRGVFILDPEGKIQSYTINNMGIGRNAEEILRTSKRHNLWPNTATKFARLTGNRVRRR